MRFALTVVVLAGLCGSALADRPSTSSAPTGTAEALILRVASLNALRHDLEAVASAAGKDWDASNLPGLLLPGALSTAPRDWPIDPARPWLAKLSVANLMSGGLAGLVVALPVTDIGALWKRLEVERSPGDEAAGGIRSFSSENATYYVREIASYAVIGAAREAVAAFELSASSSSADLPPGSVSAEIDVEVIAPALIALLAVAEQAVESRAAPDRQGLAEAGKLALDRFRVFLENTSRLQLSFEVPDDHLLVHLRNRPRASSDLEALLLDQPTEFPQLARMVPDTSSSVKLVTNFRTTPAVREGLMNWMERYTQVMSKVLASSPGTGQGLDPMLRAQLSTYALTLACQRGDMAGTWDIDPERGMAATTLIGVQERPECRNLSRELARAMTAILGPDDESVVTVTDPAVVIDGVEAQRYDLNVRGLLPPEGGPEAAEQMTRFFGGDTLTTFSGTVRDLLVTTVGARAEPDFKRTLEQVQSGTVGRGLTADSFAPLSAAGGAYLAMDLSRLGTLVGTRESVDRGRDERMVFGAHAEQGRLHIDAALPLAFFSSIAKEEEEKETSEEELPPSPKPCGKRASGVRPLILEGDDITKPKRIPESYVAPAYPETSRIGRLQARVILKAVIDADGGVCDCEVLSCKVHDAKGSPAPEVQCAPFSRAAIRAVQEWRYEPARRDGVPIDGYFAVQVDFDLK